ncbi:MAG: hypothetical protein KKA56_15150, partial [Gammaproteobacteria bacterium]|nr:hypothetical protein [Gammaproteobacteria bacterium]
MKLNLFPLRALSINMLAMTIASTLATTFCSAAFAAETHRLAELTAQQATQLMADNQLTSVELT